MATELGFEALAERLIARLNSLVQRGDASERGLAKLAGVSQPHLHNLLAGRRGLTFNVADRLLKIVNLPLASLLSSDDEEAQSPPLDTVALSIPLLAGTLGGGRGYPDSTIKNLFYPVDIKRLTGLVEPVAGVVDSAERSAQPGILPGDILVLDRNPTLRRRPPVATTYIAAWRGRALIGTISRTGGALEFRRQLAKDGAPSRLVLDASQQDLLQLLRARVAGLDRTAP